MKNLLALVSTNLELCERLPVWEWEAANEGHHDCADTLHALAEDERRSFARALDCLREHLAHAERGGP